MTNGIQRQELSSPRYEYGGDDHVFVELSEEMSFDANFEAQAITQEIRERDLPGLIEVAPANASYMLHFDPAELHPDDLIDELKSLRGDRPHRVHLGGPRHRRPRPLRRPVDPRDADEVPGPPPRPRLDGP